MKTASSLACFKRGRGMKLIIASSNAHKLVEIREILGGHFEEIVSLRKAGGKEEA